MKTVKFLFILISSFAILSCDSDENDIVNNLDDNYPITLNFKNFDEEFTFYQNGALAFVTDEVLNNYNNSRISLNRQELETEFTNDYFKFLSDTEVEVSESGDIFKAEYVFEDGFLYLVVNNGKFLYGQGDKTKLQYRLSALQTNTAGSSNAYEDEDDINDFPATFENSKDFHTYNTLEDIQGDEFLLIHNLSAVYE
ncbi:hypothetical protein [Aquimarina sp. MMG016]|uniref:hypothetical protein n=1 Tax=Aquimarina sp. MMG016 TaxID=2822690 RepID=UPI001B39E781|nr:hypothetical protein [Aquimarina sp. MMG016]MBQ4819423.1 hypothetical protein [Aquimarina sp. MMG016]